MEDVQLIELTDPEGDLARRMFELYEAAFPVEERDPPEVIKEAMRKWAAGAAPPDRAGHFYAVLHDGSFAGAVIYGYYREPRLGFLAYMATVPELRGQGLGSVLLKHILERLPADASAIGGLPPLGLCWEVEPIEGGQTPAEKALRARRIDFYRRNGAVLVSDHAFVAPPVDEGLPAVGYNLMFMPLPGETIALDQPLLHAIVDTVLLYGYDLEPDSPYYRDALAALPGRG